MNGDDTPVADEAGDPGVHDYKWIESHRVIEHHPTPTTGELPRSVWHVYEYP